FSTPPRPRCWLQFILFSDAGRCRGRIPVWLLGRLFLLGQCSFDCSVLFQLFNLLLGKLPQLLRNTVIADLCSQKGYFPTFFDHLATAATENFFIHCSK